MVSIAPRPHTRRREDTSDCWITPKWIIDRLGPFDLDPCACDPQPWPCAAESWTENGLLLPWAGRVWLNPPYGRKLGPWMNRMALHGNGVALVFARTDTRCFHDHVFPYASALCFLEGRLTFFRPGGEATPPGHNSGGPSMLISYGDHFKNKLAQCRDIGAFFENNWR